MLYTTTLLVAAAAFSSFVSAQNDTALPCCSVPASTVPSSFRSSWCQAERNTCPEVCGGPGQVPPGGNDCDSTSLNFTCTCKNGTKPDMSKYEQTVPGQMCRFWYTACINATVGDSVAQYACNQARDQNCGNLTSDGTAASSSSAATTTQASQTSGGGNAASTTVPSTSSTGGAATALAIAREFGTPLFAGGMVALFGLAL